MAIATLSHRQRLKVLVVATLAIIVCTVYVLTKNVVVRQTPQRQPQQMVADTNHPDAAELQKRSPVFSNLPLPRLPLPSAINYHEDLTYHVDRPGSNRHLKAEHPFNIPPSTLTSLGFPLRKFSTDFPDDDDGDFVFVTAADAEHLHIAMDAVALIQAWFPNNTVYFYDLGDMKPEHVEKINQLCKVRYRQFNFTRYPTHVADLHTYAFKPLLIHELLHEHPKLFWVDSSIRMSTNQLDDVIRQANHKSIGVLLFDVAGHSIYSTTHVTMYRYLPMDRQAAIKVQMWGAGAIFINCTRQLYDEIIRWWFLCALEPRCMAPTRQLYCNFMHLPDSQKPRDQYAQCHRYDQSALNVLLANYFHQEGDDDSLPYVSRNQNVLSNQRGSQHQQLIHVCDQRPNGTAAVTRQLKSAEYFL